MAWRHRSEVVDEIVALDGSSLADADWERMQLRLRADGARARLSVLRDLAAISLPWWTPDTDRLPAGVQLVTAPGDEARLLPLARQRCERRPDLTAVRIADPAFSRRGWRRG